MSLFDLYYYENKVDESKVIATAIAFGYHFDATSKVIDGVERQVFDEFGNGFDIDTTLARHCKTFDEFMEFYKNLPKHVNELKNSVDYKKRLRDMQRRLKPLSKRCNEITDLLGNHISDLNEYDRIAKETGYFEIIDEIFKITEEDPLLFYSSYFDLEGFEVQLDNLEHMQPIEKFKNFKKMAETLLEIENTLNFVRYMEHGAINKTPLETIGTKKVTLADFKIEDVIFLREKEVLRITK